MLTLPRRAIPSLANLIAFEATARHLSFSKAAEDLALSQGAVSKRVRQLEATLDVELFERDTHRVSLTETGWRYLGHVRRLLADVEDSVRGLRFTPARAQLCVAVEAGAASRWLVSRVPRFMAAYPGQGITLVSMTDVAASLTGEVDCAICEAPVPESGLRLDTLAVGSYVAVATPRFLRARRLAMPEDLRRSEMLGFDPQPELWQRWLGADRRPAERDAEGQPASTDDLSILIALALSGRGAALVPDFTVRDDLAAGHLSVLFPERRVPGSVIYLASPLAHSSSAARLETFRSWLLAERTGHLTEVHAKAPRGQKPVQEQVTPAALRGRDALHDKRGNHQPAAVCASGAVEGRGMP